MTKEIAITSSFKINVDTLGNHQPVVYKEGGEEILHGRYKGQLTKSSWKPIDKYFRNPPQAVWWGIQNGYIGEFDMTEMNLKECLQQYEEQIKILETILGNLED